MSLLIILLRALRQCFIQVIILPGLRIEFSLKSYYPIGCKLSQIISSLENLNHHQGMNKNKKPYGISDVHFSSQFVIPSLWTDVINSTLTSNLKQYTPSLYSRVRSLSSKYCQSTHSPPGPVMPIAVHLSWNATHCTSESCTHT